MTYQSGMSTQDSINAHHREIEDFFKEAFTNPVTRQPYDVPEDIKRLSRRLCQSYGIKGICDPMYIANVIAMELGRGDGQSNFWK